MARPFRLARALLRPALSGGRRLARDEQGATAIEFSILALPFFAIVMAIFETALVFFAGQVLDSAVQDASRYIRTGQAQTAGFDMPKFRAAVCERLYGLFDCSQLRLKVSEVTAFANAASTTPIDPATGQWTLAESYGGGMGSSIVLVEAYYKWGVLFNFNGFRLDNTADGKRLLSAVRVFRNEPFGGGA